MVFDREKGQYVERRSFSPEERILLGDELETDFLSSRERELKSEIATIKRLVPVNERHRFYR